MARLLQSKSSGEEDDEATDASANLGGGAGEDGHARAGGAGHGAVDGDGGELGVREDGRAGDPRAGDHGGGAGGGARRARADDNGGTAGGLGGAAILVASLAKLHSRRDLVFDVVDFNFDQKDELTQSWARRRRQQGRC